MHAGITENFTIESLGILHEKLTTKLAASFESLGIQLGLELSEIKALSYKDVDVVKNLRSVLDQWKADGEGRDGAEALRLIIQALKSSTVKQIRLANDLEVKWKDCYCECYLRPLIIFIGRKNLFFPAVA